MQRDIMDRLDGDEVFEDLWLHSEKPTVWMFLKQKTLGCCGASPFSKKLPARCVLQNMVRYGDVDQVVVATSSGSPNTDEVR